MPVTKEPTTREDEDTPQPRKVRKPTKFTVRKITPDGVDPVIFSHEDRGVARRHVEDNHPRGLEVYVQHPDGFREHYSADQHFQGSDNQGWNELTEDDV
jgi:hypothetical protein